MTTYTINTTYKQSGQVCFQARNKHLTWREQVLCKDALVKASKAFRQFLPLSLHELL